MKGCFAFNKKVYENIVKKSEEDIQGAFIDLLEYIKYGLYNEIRDDMSHEDQLRYQRIFNTRVISFAKKTDGLFGGDFKWLKGVGVGNADKEAYNKLKEEYDKLDIIDKKKNKIYNEIIENLKKAINIMSPTQEQREEIRNAGIDLEGLGVLDEEDMYYQQM